MTDYISREDALNFEMEIEADPDEIQAISKGMALYGEYIKSIPAAEVMERKRGEWQPLNSLTNKCTSCGEKYWFYLGIPYNFCPHCGADMRGDSDV